jgi:hypothetical protein
VVPTRPIADEVATAGTVADVDVVPNVDVAVVNTGSIATADDRSISVTRTVDTWTVATRAGTIATYARTVTARVRSIAANSRPVAARARTIDAAANVWTITSWAWAIDTTKAGPVAAGTRMISTQRWSITGTWTPADFGPIAEVGSITHTGPVSDVGTIPRARSIAEVRTIATC